MLMGGAFFPFPYLVTGLASLYMGAIVLTRNSAYFSVHPKIIKNIFREIRYIAAATLARKRQPVVAGLFYKYKPNHAELPPPSLILD